MKIPYRIEFDSRVKKDLKSIPSQDINRIKSAILQLSNNPYPSGGINHYSLIINH